MVNTPATPIAWTWFVRLTHWLVACAVIINMLNDTGYWHRTIGYACFVAVLMRVGYGLCWSQHAASKLYLPTLTSIKHHILELLRGDLSPHIGHNPLGQMAVYAMWLLLMALTFTGWLSRTDAYWGEDWPVILHGQLSNLLMGLVVMHIAAVLLCSKLQKQNLIKQMLNGKVSKRKSP